MTLGENSGEGNLVGGYRGRERKLKKISEDLFCTLTSAPSPNLLLFRVTVDGSLQILVLVFVGATACGNRVGGLLCLLAFFCMELTEEPEDRVEAHPGSQLMPLCACVEKISTSAYQDIY